jgi:tricorn protease interacting factor F2/3
MAGASIHPDIARSIMQIGARALGTKALEWLLHRFTASPSEHERMNILTALGAFEQWEVIEQALAFTLEKVPPRNRFLPIVAAAADPGIAPHLWDWYKDHLQAVEAFHPLLYERVITGMVPLAGIGRKDEVSGFFLDYRKKAPQYDDAIALALENLAINERMRRAAAP